MTNHNYQRDINAQLSYSSCFNLNKQSPSAAHFQPSITSDAERTLQPTLLYFDQLDVESILELNGDHLNDAKLILENVFNHKLIKLDNKLHFFNGRDCVAINDDVMRRHIAKAMGNGSIRVTQNRIASTYAVLKDQIPNGGSANPPNLKVFFSDCVFNLATGKVEQHSIDNRNTRSLAVKYNTKPKCPSFKRWLKKTFSDDLDNVAYLQELIGWTLCRNNFGIEKAIMLLGPPRAGKGILLRLIRSLHNGGASSFRFGNLCDDRTLSSMRDSYIAIDSDAVSPKKFDAHSVMGLFKVITSNESVPNKLLYIQDMQDSALNCKLCIAANSSPVLIDDSQASANRWLPLIFNKSFQGKEDTTLFNKFNSELEGIVNWAFAGLKRLVKRKQFKLPKASIEQLELMASEGGSLHTFISDELVIDKSYRCSEKDVWEQYSNWANRNGYEVEKRALIIRAVEDAVRQYGVRRHKSVKINGRDQRGFYGLSPKAILIPSSTTFPIAG